MDSEATDPMTSEQRIAEWAAKAGIQPNDMVRFIVDYDNGVDMPGPCAAVVTFCEHLIASLAAS